jgi:hypothetical protein
MPPRKRTRLSKYGGVQADDMSLVTPENVSSRRGWKVTSTGKLHRPMRMRPLRPLPPTSQQLSHLLSTASQQNRSSSLSKLKQKKRLKAPPVRARRKTIDVTKWRGERLTGAFLASASGAIETGVRRPPSEDISAYASNNRASAHSVSADHLDGSVPAQATPATTGTVTAPAKVQAQTQSQVAKARPTVDNFPGQQDLDLSAEKEQSLAFLQSLFAGKGTEWTGVLDDSDIEEEIQKQPRSSTTHDVTIGSSAAAAAEDFEVVPMDVDSVPAQVLGLGVKSADKNDDEPADEDTPEDRGVAPPSSQPTPGLPSKPQTLKDMFAPREEKGMFFITK